MGDFVPNSVIKSSNYQKNRVRTDTDEQRIVPDFDFIQRVPPGVGIQDEPTRCYRINHQWAKLVMGWVSWLAELSAWSEADDETYIGIRAILTFMQGETCMPFQLRQSPLNSCILEQSLDGVSWLPVFDFSLCSTIQDKSHEVTNQNNYTYSFENIFQNIYNEFTTNYSSSPTDVHPELEYGVGNDDDLDGAYCNAVYVLVSAACDAAIQYYRDQDETQQGINVGLAIGAIILTAIAVAGALPTAGASLAGLSALAGAWATVIGITAPLGNGLVDKWQATSIDNYQDTAAIYEVVCYIVDNLPGDDNTLATMQAVLDGHTLTDNAAAIADTLNLFLEHDSTYAAFIEKWNNNLQYAQAGIELFCPCVDDVWEKTFDFTLGLQEGWEPNVIFTGSTPGADRAVWAGDGWTRSTANGGTIVIEREFTWPADTIVTQVKWFISDQAGASFNLTFGLPYTNGIAHGTMSPPGENTANPNFMQGTRTGLGIEHSVFAAGPRKLTKIILIGTGTEPTW